MPTPFPVNTSRHFFTLRTEWILSLSPSREQWQSEPNKTPHPFSAADGAQIPWSTRLLWSFFSPFDAQAFLVRAMVIHFTTKRETKTMERRGKINKKEKSSLPSAVSIMWISTRNWGFFPGTGSYGSLHTVFGKRKDLIWLNRKDQLHFEQWWLIRVVESVWKSFHYWSEVFFPLMHKNV